MKKFLSGLTALAICGALNFGLTTDAQAAELNPAININSTEYQELSRHRKPPPPPPPPPPGYERHRPLPYYRDERPRKPQPPPPPPPRYGHDRHRDYPPPQPSPPPRRR